MAVSSIAIQLPSKGGQVRVATIHRHKGPESPVRSLGRGAWTLAEEDLASLLLEAAEPSG